MAERLVDRGRGDAGLLHQRARGGDGMFHQRPVDLQSGGCRPSEAADLVAVPVRQVEKLLGRLHRLGGGDDHGLGEKIEPGFPVSGHPHVVEQLVVILAVRLEIEAEVEHRLPQHLLFAQEQRD